MYGRCGRARGYCRRGGELAHGAQVGEWKRTHVRRARSAAAFDKERVPTLADLGTPSIPWTAHNRLPAKTLFKTCLPSPYVESVMPPFAPPAPLLVCRERPYLFAKQSLCLP